LKRVREIGRAPFRYLAALEEHENGEYHMHVLAHEVAGEIGERTWRNAWKPTGFAQAKLVHLDPRQLRRTAIYVAKYMNKENGFPRQRASTDYGQGGLRKTQPEGANRPVA
jgi:hypothetical protein